MINVWIVTGQEFDGDAAVLGVFSHKPKDAAVLALAAKYYDVACLGLPATEGRRHCWRYYDLVIVLDRHLVARPGGMA